MGSRFKEKLKRLSWQPVLATSRAIGIWFLITLCIAVGLLTIDFAITSWINAQGSLVSTAISLIAVASLATLLVLAYRNKWDKVVWISTVALVLLVGILLSARYWDELRGSEESLSATIRNVGLLIGGVIAALLAMWRSAVAERQAEIAERRTDIAQQGMLSDRYQKSAEMLGSTVLSVRLGGVYALDRLANEHPEEYHIQAMEALCAFARRPTNDEQVETELREDIDGDTGGRRLREDVESAMRAIAFRSEKGIAMESQTDLPLYLRGAVLSDLRIEDGNLVNTLLVRTDLSDARLGRAILSDVSLRSSDLTRAILWHADLSGADLVSANLTGTNLWNANLSGAILAGAELRGAELLNANLTGANLSHVNPMVSSPARGLTQSQLDAACADPDNPPDLSGVVDVETGKRLEWRGRAVS